MNMIEANQGSAKVPVFAVCEKSCKSQEVHRLWPVPQEAQLGDFIKTKKSQKSNSNRYQPLTLDDSVWSDDGIHDRPGGDQREREVQAPQLDTIVPGQESGQESEEAEDDDSSDPGLVDSSDSENEEEESRSEVSDDNWEEPTISDMVSEMKECKCKKQLETENIGHGGDQREGSKKSRRGRWRRPRPAAATQDVDPTPETETPHAQCGSCWAFSVGEADKADQEADRHNQQIVKMIDGLGKFGAGRRAILQAIAARQGIVGEDELEALYSGKSGTKIQVPKSMRQALIDIGLGDALAEVNILTVASTQDILVNTDAWEDLEFEVALDSGSVVHVCAPEDISGYHVGDSAGSRRGQEFLMGDGGTIPNLGESRLNLSEDGKDLQ